ncbi:hypothetical protein [Streptacidiphilus neutrinimicus]|uniref:hypothetical protein n=1 Tax=Streptacidiphilus neutrinimicus TaxID=105420 RepID=UPI0005A84FB8|nr:hypothetical protein [Streptacidiphilus neutrinimicus]
MNAAPGTGAPASAPESGFDVDPAYLHAAREAGLAHTLDGRTYVADAYLEPVTGEQQCLVEYAHPALLADPPRLLAAVFSLRPACTSAVVRTMPDTPSHPALGPLTTYLRYAPAAELPPAADAPPVGWDDGRLHDASVADWLARALTTAARDRGQDAGPAAARDAAARLMADPSRRSCIVRHPHTGVPLGHATVLTDAYDDVSGTAFVELVDILLDGPGRTRAATGTLVHACAGLAAELGLPLLGNVSHPRPDHPGGPDPAARVVAALQAGGWRPTHLYRYAERP